MKLFSTTMMTTMMMMVMMMMVPVVTIIEAQFAAASTNVLQNPTPFSDALPPNTLHIPEFSTDFGYRAEQLVACFDVGPGDSGGQFFNAWRSICQQMDGAGGNPLNGWYLGVPYGSAPSATYDTMIDFAGSTRGVHMGAYNTPPGLGPLRYEGLPEGRLANVLVSVGDVSMAGVDLRWSPGLEPNYVGGIEIVPSTQFATRSSNDIAQDVYTVHCGLCERSPCNIPKDCNPAGTTGVSGYFPHCVCTCASSKFHGARCSTNTPTISFTHSESHTQHSVSFSFSKTIGSRSDSNPSLSATQTTSSSISVASFSVSHSSSLSSTTSVSSSRTLSAPSASLSKSQMTLTTTVHTPTSSNKGNSVTSTMALTPSNAATASRPKHRSPTVQPTFSGLTASPSMETHPSPTKSVTDRIPLTPTLSLPLPQIIPRATPEPDKEDTLTETVGGITYELDRRVIVLSFVMDVPVEAAKFYLQTARDRLIEILSIGNPDHFSIERLEEVIEGDQQTVDTIRRSKLTIHISNATRYGFDRFNVKYYILEDIKDAEEKKRQQDAINFELSAAAAESVARAAAAAVTTATTTTTTTTNNNSNNTSNSTGNNETTLPLASMSSSTVSNDNDNNASSTTGVATTQAPAITQLGRHFYGKALNNNNNIQQQQSTAPTLMNTVLLPVVTSHATATTTTAPLTTAPSTTTTTTTTNRSAPPPLLYPDNEPSTRPSTYISPLLEPMIVIKSSVTVGFLVISSALANPLPLADPNSLDVTTIIIAAVLVVAFCGVVGGAAIYLCCRSSGSRPAIVTASSMMPTTTTTTTTTEGGGNNNKKNELHLQQQQQQQQPSDDPSSLRSLVLHFNGNDNGGGGWDPVKDEATILKLYMEAHAKQQQQQQQQQQFGAVAAEQQQQQMPPYYFHHDDDQDHHHRRRYFNNSNPLNSNAPRRHSSIGSSTGGSTSSGLVPLNPLKGGPTLSSSSNNNTSTGTIMTNQRRRRMSLHIELDAIVPADTATSGILGSSSSNFVNNNNKCTAHKNKSHFTSATTTTAAASSCLSTRTRRGVRVVAVQRDVDETAEAVHSLLFSGRGLHHIPRGGPLQPPPTPPSSRSSSCDASSR